MLYKHWKKIALAVTSFFWASCDNTSSANDDNSPESSSSIETPKSSSATNGAASSSEAAAPESSSSAEQAVSSSSEDNQNVASSSSLNEPIVPQDSIIAGPITPKYGVVIKSSSSEEVKPKSSSSAEIVAPKYGVMKPVCERNGSTLRCDDGVTCEEKTKTEYANPECFDEICPEYGVVEITNKTYTCDDGKVYNEAEFRSKYDILDGAVDLYGCPSDICGKITDEEQN